MAQQPVKALIISVGDNPEAVVLTINSLQPECLCFFVSEDTKGIIDGQIIPKLIMPPKKWDQIETSDSEDLKKCCASLVSGLQGLLGRWGVEPSQLTVDYTGGTKTMSAALLLCTIDASSSYHFTGGREQEVYQVNPWDELQVRASHEAAVVFNKGHYSHAALLFQRIEKRVSGGSKPLYKALVDLSEGYALWDAFDYKGGWNKLHSARKALEMATLFGGPPGLKTLVSGLKENMTFLEKIVMGREGVKPEIFFDLLSSAKRRAELDHKYEDATARLYRAFEVLAQIKLSEKGFNTNDIDLVQLPASLREEFVQRHTSNLDGKVKISLDAAYRLLSELGDELGLVFNKNWNNLKILFDARNLSILAHGFAPIKPERYKQLWEMVLKTSDTRPERLPQFPKMEL
ncbi:MAG TPA: TIGR02710 family CRISPR-associated CARF protein [Nitrospiria bacterium]|nr:TIGR02710 family CRISPR-associated CARF protein [Nitrospiria bacterium]